MPVDLQREELTVQRERAILVGVALPDRPWLTEDPLEEIRGLAESASAHIGGGLPTRGGVKG